MNRRSVGWDGRQEAVRSGLLRVGRFAQRRQSGGGRFVCGAARLGEQGSRPIAILCSDDTSAIGLWTNNQTRHDLIWIKDARRATRILRAGAGRRDQGLRALPAIAVAG